MKMTNFSQAITKEEAIELCNCKYGMNYFPTEHNKKMIAEVLHEVIMNLPRG
jgi:hypothetical protein